MTKAQKFPEAEARLYTRVFICRKWGTKMRCDLLKVKAKKVKCRKCKARQLRAIRKDLKV